MQITDTQNINVEKINNLLISETQSNHSIKLLKDIIESIEVYPELYKVKKSDEITRSKQKNYKKELEEIEQNYISIKNKIKSSNIKSIKELLIEIENKLIAFYNVNDKNNIKYRIKYLNDSKLIEILKKERKLKLKLKNKELDELKVKLKKELKNIDKNLLFYAKLTKTNNGFNLSETLNQETKLDELFEKISVEKLIEDMELEDYKKEFYKQLGSNPLDSDYYNLYIENKNPKLNNLRISTYPNLKIITTLKNIKFNDKKLNEEVKEIQKQSIEVADLLIRVKQLENLQKYIEKNNYEITTKYIEEEIKQTKQIIIKKELKLNQETSMLNLKNIPKQEKYKFYKELLEITANESKNKFNYNLGSFEYKQMIQQDVYNYQNFILAERYNITLEELNNLILNQDEDNSIMSKEHNQVIKTNYKKKKKSLREFFKNKLK